jgi:hypothetical protein
VTNAPAPRGQTTSADPASSDVFSPELALVSPELRALAIAALPPIEVANLAPLPLIELASPLETASAFERAGAPEPETAAPLPSETAPERAPRSTIVQVAWIGFLAFIAVVIVVLALTLVANALR